MPPVQSACEPLPENDLPFLDRLCTGPDVLGEFEWPGFIDPRTRRQRWERDGYIAAGSSAAAIVRGDGRVAGIATWKPRGFPAGVAYEIGVGVANIGEQKALERLGFRRGRLMRGRSFLRGVLIYGLLREAPRPATAPCADFGQVPHRALSAVSVTTGEAWQDPRKVAPGFPGLGVICPGTCVHFWDEGVP
jgi:[ribosomal protein S5]-alanine N-acetyltransferase